MDEIDVLSFIPTGERNAISAGFLCAAIDVKTVRELRRIIHEARIQGNLICSGEHGYFVPETVDELKKFVIRYEAAAFSTREMLQAAKEQIKKMEEGSNERSTQNHKKQ